MQVNFTINIDDRIIKTIKAFFKKRSVMIVTICLVMTTLLIAYAADDEDTNNSIELKAGNLIKADDLMKKFNYLYRNISTGGIDMVGFILPYAGQSPAKADIPDGWALCDGSTLQVTETDYQSLCQKLTGGACPSGSTVTLPDLRGRVIAGVDTAGNVLPNINNANTIHGTYGQAELDLQADQLPEHKHQYVDKVRAFNTATDDINIGGTTVPYTFISDTNYVNYTDPNNKTLTDEEIYHYIDLTDDSVDNPTWEPVTTQQPVKIVQPTISLWYLIRTK